MVKSPQLVGSSMIPLRFQPVKFGGKSKNRALENVIKIAKWRKRARRPRNCDDLCQKQTIIVHLNFNNSSGLHGYLYNFLKLVSNAIKNI